MISVDAKFIRNFKAIEIDLKRLISEVADWSVGQIQQETMAGRDVEGEPFKVYTTPYKKAKQKAGHRVNKVDLTVNSTMIKAVFVKSIDSGQIIQSGMFKGQREVSATIGVRPTARKAYVFSKGKVTPTGKDLKYNNEELARFHQEGAGRNKRRPWFGVRRSISARQRKEWLNLLRAHFKVVR